MNRRKFMTTFLQAGALPFALFVPTLPTPPAPRKTYIVKEGGIYNSNIHGDVIIQGGLDASVFQSIINGHVTVTSRYAQIINCHIDCNQKTQAAVLFIAQP